VNERIKELALQAGWSGFEALDERHQKFAELIVRECAGVQMKRSCERHGYDKHEDAQAIKQHFGVEE